MITSCNASRPRGGLGRRSRCAALLLALGLALPLAAPLDAWARHGHRPHATQPAHPPRAVRTARAAHRQVGLASYYAARFHGRRMADGTRLHRDSDSAASRTLPLGTTARVTNLHNGRSAVVTIRDRGPHGRGRIIDVSPGVARQLGMTARGVARVEVVALRLPTAGKRRQAGQRHA
jgi:rare lipoprotein A